MNKTPAVFNAQLARMERDHRGRQGVSNGKGRGPRRDEGSERSIELCERLLDDFERQEAAENAKLASHPNAAAIGASLQKSLADALEREKQLRERLKEMERNESGKVGDESPVASEAR